MVEYDIKVEFPTCQILMHWDCRASWPPWETGMYPYIVCAHIWMYL